MGVKTRPALSGHLSYGGEDTGPLWGRYSVDRRSDGRTKGTVGARRRYPDTGEAPWREGLELKSTGL